MTSAELLTASTPPSAMVRPEASTWQPLAEPHDERHVVVDDQQAEVPALGERAQQREQRLRLLLVHARGGLVEQQKAGIGGESPGDLDTGACHRSSEIPAGSSARENQPELAEQIVGLPPGPHGGRQPWATAATSTFSRTVRLAKTRTI